MRDQRDTDGDQVCDDDDETCATEEDLCEPEPCDPSTAYCEEPDPCAVDPTLEDCEVSEPSRS